MEFVVIEHRDPRSESFLAQLFYRSSDAKRKSGSRKRERAPGGFAKSKARY
jgi:hypothetical protein